MSLQESLDSEFTNVNVNASNTTKRAETYLSKHLFANKVRRFQDLV